APIGLGSIRRKATGPTRNGVARQHAVSCADCCRRPPETSLQCLTTKRRFGPLDGLVDELRRFLGSADADAHTRKPGRARSPAFGQRQGKSQRIIGRALQSSGARCAVRREKSPATFPRPADSVAILPGRRKKSRQKPRQELPKRERRYGA